MQLLSKKICDGKAEGYVLGKVTYKNSCVIPTKKVSGDGPISKENVP